VKCKCSSKMEIVFEDEFGRIYYCFVCGRILDSIDPNNKKWLEHIGVQNVNTTDYR